MVVDSPVKQTQMKKDILLSKVSGGWVDQIMNIEIELWLLGRSAKESDVKLLNDLQPYDEIQILKLYVELVQMCQKKVRSENLNVYLFKNWEVLKNRAGKIALVKEFVPIARWVKRRSERLNKIEESKAIRDKARVVELLSKRKDKQFEASRNCKAGCKIQDKIKHTVHPIKGKDKGTWKNSDSQSSSKIFNIRFWC